MELEADFAVLFRDTGDDLVLVGAAARDEALPAVLSQAFRQVDAPVLTDGFGNVARNEAASPVGWDGDYERGEAAGFGAR